MKYCNKCGNTIDINKIFCNNCGEKNKYYNEIKIQSNTISSSTIPLDHKKNDLDAQKEILKLKLIQVKEDALLKKENELLLAQKAFEENKKNEEEKKKQEAEYVLRLVKELNDKKNELERLTKITEEEKQKLILEKQNFEFIKKEESKTKQENKSSKDEIIQKDSNLFNDSNKDNQEQLTYESEKTNENNNIVTDEKTKLEANKLRKRKLIKNITKTSVIIFILLITTTIGYFIKHKYDSSNIIFEKTKYAIINYPIDSSIIFLQKTISDDYYYSTSEQNRDSLKTWLNVLLIMKENTLTMNESILKNKLDASSFYNINNNNSKIKSELGNGINTIILQSNSYKQFTEINDRYYTENILYLKKKKEPIITFNNKSYDIDFLTNQLINKENNDATATTYNEKKTKNNDDLNIKLNKNVPQINTQTNINNSSIETTSQKITNDMIKKDIINKTIGDWHYASSNEIKRISINSTKNAGESKIVNATIDIIDITDNSRFIQDIEITYNKSNKFQKAVQINFEQI